jgi:hypothetical protein
MRRPLPGHRVQLDVKFIEPLAGSRSGSRRKHYQCTAIDDCTRLRVLRIYPQLNQQTALQFLDDVLERLPFRVEVIQTDNGVEFGASFHWHVLDKGIGHVYIKPRTPRLNGKVERSHRIDAEEFYRLLDGVVIDDTKVFNDKLREWKDFYNYSRPHRALSGQTPYERLKQRTQARVQLVPVTCTLRRYRASGLAGLEDRSHRPRRCPHQASAQVEAQVCELRRQHPGWGRCGCTRSSSAAAWSRCRRGPGSTASWSATT